LLYFFRNAIIAVFVDGSGLRIKSGLFFLIIYKSFLEYSIKKEGSFPSNLDQLSTNTNLNYLEQENAPAKIFLKISACPSTYKKKLAERIVKTILVNLLIFEFDTFDIA
tara:strand:+ start:102 stop:428 length:327 start_codon:yes stop_codon:yes gene_type:complete